MHVYGGQDENPVDTAGKKVLRLTLDKKLDHSPAQKCVFSNSSKEVEPSDSKLQQHRKGSEQRTQKQMNRDYRAVEGECDGRAMWSGQLCVCVVMENPVHYCLY